MDLFKTFVILITLYGTAAQPTTCADGSSGSACQATSESPLPGTLAPDSPLSETETTDPPLSETQNTDSLLPEIQTTDSPLSKTQTTDSPLPETETTDSQLPETHTNDSPLPETPTTDSQLLEAQTNDSPLTEIPASDSPLPKTLGSKYSLPKTPAPGKSNSNAEHQRREEEPHSMSAGLVVLTAVGALAAGCLITWAGVNAYTKYSTRAYTLPSCQYDVELGERNSVVRGSNTTTGSTRSLLV